MTRPLPVGQAADAGQARSVFAGVDVCDLAGLRVVAGAVRPTFDDDVWNFDGLADAPGSMQPAEKRWDFTTIRHPAWRIVAKELLLAQLAPVHPAVASLPAASRTPRSPRFCRLVLREMVVWFNWLNDQHVGRLAEVTQAHCDRYLAQRSYTQERPRRLLVPGTRKRIAATVQQLAAYNDLYSADRHRSGFVPWQGRTAWEVVGGQRTATENAVQPLPDAHLRPLLAAALHLVEHVGPHLAATVEQHGTTGKTTARWGEAAATTPRPDGEPVPWTLPLTAQQVRTLVTLTHLATLIVTAALTGMRASELAEIHIGARRDPALTPGGGRRFRLTAKVIKGRKFGGETDEWIVLPVVDTAIALAERLLPHLLQTRPRGTRIFGRYWAPAQYRRFRDWVNGPEGRRLGLEPIPDGPCNPRMMRRALARELARRPGGLLAAKIALKHISVVTTEGYTRRPGGSQALFRAEVEQAEQAHHRSLTTVLFRDYQEGILPTGPGARRLIAAFAHVDTALGQEPPEATVMDTERRIENLLRATASTLHIGAANYCWFHDPSQALCLRMAGTLTAVKPLAGMCDSAACPQATHHPCHRPVWQDRADTYQALLDNPRISTGEKHRLRPEYDRTLNVLHQITGSSR